MHFPISENNHIHIEKLKMYGSSEMITRIAPTPSGYLHIGNAFSFVLTYILSKVNNGKILLRIDDLDQARIRKEYIDDIFETVDWLNISYDIGPKSTDDFLQNWSQQSRIHQYHSLIEKLESIEGLCYYCSCSRSTTQPCNCASKKLGYIQNETALKVKVPYQEITINDVKGKTIYHDVNDFIIKRKDGIPAYQIASLADDIYYHINFVVRGMDLLPSTAAQLFLGEQLQESEFSNMLFLHHDLIKNEQQEKLSKSAGAVSIKYMREHNLKPEVIYNRVADYLQIKSDVSSMEELLDSTLSSF